MSGGGAALGVSALTTTNDASVAQYGAPPAGAVQGERETRPTEPGARGAPDDGREILGERVGGDQPDARSFAQAPRQLASDSGDAELPFTGFAAIPMALFGLALLATGLALRRSTRRGTSQA